MVRFPEAEEPRRFAAVVDTVCVELGFTVVAVKLTELR
jgi:hypothetical protein